MPGSFNDTSLILSSIFSIYIYIVKRIKNILALVSLLIFVVAFSVFVISAFLGAYGNLIWSGFTSFLAFAVMLVVAGIPR